MRSQMTGVPSSALPEGPDAGATLSMAQKLGDRSPEGPLKRQVSDAFNEGEAAEWLLRLG